MELPCNVRISTWEPSSPSPVRFHTGRALDTNTVGMSPDEAEIIGHALILTAQKCRRDEKRLYDSLNKPTPRSAET